MKSLMEGQEDRGARVAWGRAPCCFVVPNSYPEPSGMSHPPFSPLVHTPQHAHTYVPGCCPEHRDKLGWTISEYCEECDRIAALATS